MVDYENWMRDLAPKLTHLRLNLLAIPGSHNSFSYTINSQSPVSPDCELIYERLYRCLGRLVSPSIVLWGKTQSKTFTEQLQMGIRYFDLRVTIRVNGPDGGREPYFSHGLYAMSVLSALTEINNFLTKHPREVVLLDFNHLIKFELQDHLHLRDIIFQVLGSRLIPVSSSAPTLHELWSQGHQALVFYHSCQLPPDHKYKLWPGNLCLSLWPNTPDPQEMVAYAERRSLEFRERPANFFFVCQGVLTPTKRTVFGHLFKGVIYLAQIANPPFLQWLSGLKPGRVNATIVDFVEFPQYVDTVIKLNQDIVR